MDNKAYKGAGGNLHRREMTSRLANNHEVHILATQFYDDFSPLVRVHRVEIPTKLPLHLRYIAYILRSVPVARQLIKKFDIEAIIGAGQDSSSTMLPVAMTKLLKRQVKAIFVPRLPIKGLKQRMLSKFMKTGDLIVAASQTVEMTLHSYGFSKANIVVDGDGITLPQKPLTPRTKDIDCLFVGRHTPEKGISDLLNIWEIINRRAPRQQNLTLVSVGEILHSKIEKAIKNLEAEPRNYKHIGNIPHEQIWDYFQRAKVLVYPSHYDAFPLVIIEAMYAGIPAVVWDISPFNIEFKHFKGVVKVKAFEIEEFTDKVLELVSDERLRQELGDWNRND